MDSFIKNGEIGNKNHKNKQKNSFFSESLQETESNNLPPPKIPKTSELSDMYNNNSNIPLAHKTEINNYSLMNTSTSSDILDFPCSNIPNINFPKNMESLDSDFPCFNLPKNIDICKSYFSEEKNTDNLPNDNNNKFISQQDNNEGIDTELLKKMSSRVCYGRNLKHSIINEYQ